MTHKESLLGLQLLSAHCSGELLDMWLFPNVRFRECGMRLPLYYGRPINISSFPEARWAHLRREAILSAVFLLFLNTNTTYVFQNENFIFLLIFFIFTNLSPEVHYEQKQKAENRRIKRKKHVTLKWSSEKRGLGVGRDSLLISLQMDKVKSPKHLYSSDEFFLDGSHLEPEVQEPTAFCDYTPF